MAQKNLSNNKGLAIGMSYAYNMPLLILIAFIFVVLIYQLFQAHRTKQEVLKHKVETEIKKKLYY